MQRCDWGVNEPELSYHDTEWGVPVHNDNKHYEFLVLEGAQAGLSWRTVLLKREGYRQAFYDFDPKKVSLMTEDDVERLVLNPGIIRNRAKIRSAINNASAFLKVQEEFGSFDSYLWSFVEGKPVVGRWKSVREIPATTPLSDAVSKDLKKRGFTFVGSTVIYAHLQAVGIVNDHEEKCFRFAELTQG